MKEHYITPSTKVFKIKTRKTILTSSRDIYGAISTGVFGDEFDEDFGW